MPPGYIQGIPEEKRKQISKLLKGSEEYSVLREVAEMQLQAMAFALLLDRTDDVDKMREARGAYDFWEHIRFIIETDYDRPEQKTD